MTNLEARAKQFVEEWKQKYEEASRDGYYPSLWVHLENLCISFTQQETKLLSEHILTLQADKGRLTDELAMKSNTNYQLIEQLAEQEEQITEAKKTIQALYYCLKNYDKVVLCGELVNAITKAEAFIKE